jgi:sulfite exporter TauE/SafE
VFEIWSAYCSAHPWVAETVRWLGVTGTIPLLFAAGLLGGVTHCAGMCGPFVLAQATAAQDGPADLGEGRRLVRALLWPYHLGRLTTYVGLGAAAGGTAGVIVAFSGYRWIPSVLLGLAAVTFLIHGLDGLLRRFGLAPSHLPNPLAGPIVKLARPLLARPEGWRGYGLGVALGFLPCGLLWGALGAAAGSGNVWLGGANMAAFALGTMPSLFLVGYLGVFFRNRAAAATRAVSIPLMLGNAGFLGYLAFRALA